MKKFLLISAFTLLALNINIISANAKTPDTFDNFIFSLLNDQIKNEVTDHYNDDSVKFGYT
jgi:hypothetical protein